MWNKYHIPKILRKHSENVTKVCAFIAHRYCEKSIIDEKTKYKIIIAGLLHDLMKLADPTTNYEKFLEENSSSEEEIKFWYEQRNKFKLLSHEKSVAQILEEQNHNHIARIIKNMEFENIDNLLTYEEKILYYSDKRDEMATIVSVAERLIKASKRYIHIQDTIEKWKTLVKVQNKILDMEKSLFEKIDALPEECNSLNDINFDDLMKKYYIDKDKKV